MTRTAIIIGAGVAGLAAGHALQKAGYRIAIYEQAQVLKPRGAALSLWANAKEALRRIGMLDAVAAAGTQIEALSIVMASGKPLVGKIVLAEPGLIVPRTDLQFALAEPLKHVIQLGIKVVAMGDDSALPHLTVGEHEVVTDLIVDASGLHSTIADRLICNEVYYRGAGGVVAIADQTATALSGCGVEYLGDGERAGLMPLSAGRSYWWFMRDQVEPQVAISVDEIGRRTRSWPTALTNAIAHTRADNAYPVAIFARDRPRRLGRRNIICIGDAAHGMDPNQGQGACQALEDAAVLGELATRLQPCEILPEFERARLSRVRNIMERSAFWSHAAHGSVIVQKLVRGLTKLTPTKALDKSMETVHRMPP